MYGHMGIFIKVVLGGGGKRRAYTCLGVSASYVSGSASFPGDACGDTCSQR